MSEFSIIIPTYNSAKTIGACIQSVLKQTYADFEMWIIDGLSDDNTVQIAESYIDNTNRIKIISEKDEGIYDAMNKGVLNSTGKWLYFLGSDDELYDENILSIITQTIRSNPDSKFVYGDVITSNNQTEKYANYQYDQLLSRCICHQSIFYHHSLFAETKYDLKYKLASDWDFNLKTFKKEIHPVYVNQLIAKFNLEGASGEWQSIPEYVDNFSNKTSMILRYKGGFYLMGYVMLVLYRKTLKRIKWTFQS